MVNRKDKNEAETGRNSYQLTEFLLTSSGPRQEQSGGGGEARGPPATHSQHYKMFAEYDQQTSKTLGFPGL